MKKSKKSDVQSQNPKRKKSFSRFYDKAFNSIIESNLAHAIRRFGNASLLISRSSITSGISHIPIKKKVINPFIRTLSRSTDNSRIFAYINILLRTMLLIPMNIYGTFLISLGIYTAFVDLVKDSIAERALAFDYLAAAPAILLIMFSIPLLFMTKTSLASAVKNGFFLRIILITALGIPVEFFRENEGIKRINPIIIFFAGMGFGSLTYLYPLSSLLALILAIIVAIMILYVPESGIMLSIYVFPFLGTSYVINIIIFTFFAYLAKLLRGRRTITFTMTDFAVIFFIAICAMSASSSLTPQSSSLRLATLVCFALQYFLIVNLITTGAYLRKVTASVITSTITLGILYSVSYIITLLTPSITFLEHLPFATIIEYLNIDTMSEPVILSAPFFIAFFYLKKTRAGKFSMIFCISMLFVFMISQNSRAAFIATIVSLLICIALSGRKKILPFGVLAIIFPIIMSFMPQIARDFIDKSLGFTDTSMSEKFEVWKNTLLIIKDNWFTGVGLGDSSFSFMYQKAVGNLNTSVQNANFFLMLLVGMGFIGLISLFCVLFFAFAEALCAHRNALYDSSGGGSRNIMTAAIASIGGILVFGITDHIWSDPRALCMFWVTIAIIIASARIMKREYTFAQSGLCELTLRYKSTLKPTQIDNEKWSQNVEYIPPKEKREDVNE